MNDEINDDRPVPDVVCPPKNRLTLDKIITKVINMLIKKNNN